MCPPGFKVRGSPENLLHHKGWGAGFWGFFPGQARKNLGVGLEGPPAVLGLFPSRGLPFLGVGVWCFGWGFPKGSSGSFFLFVVTCRGERVGGVLGGSFTPVKIKRIPCGFGGKPITF